MCLCVCVGGWRGDSAKINAILHCISIQFHASKVKSGLLVVLLTGRAVWKFAQIIVGARSVMIYGIHQMPMWLADSWVIQGIVRRKVSSKIATVDNI